MKVNRISRNLMLTIDQISQLTGVRKSTLRYWEKSFIDFLRPARTQSNRREYSIEDLDMVKAIKRLLEEEHLTAQGVRLRLQEVFPPEGGKGGLKLTRAGRKRRSAPTPANKDASVQKPG
jgi:DNA-binding transcriptional MerR regulator